MITSDDGHTGLTSDDGHMMITTACKHHLTNTFVGHMDMAPEMCNTRSAVGIST